MSELQQIEDFLQGKMSASDRLVMEARVLVDPELAEKCRCQQLTYDVIRIYGLKAEIKAMEKKVFTQKKYAFFQQKVISIFS